MKKIIFMFCMSCMLLSGCGKKEINALKAENKQLKNTIVQLQEEMKALKETDQGLFSSSVDKLNTAKSKQQWQEVANDFRVFGQKFPNSQYISQAQSYLDQADRRVKELQKIYKALQDIENSVQKQHWKTARQTLQNIKSDIPTEQYEKLKNYIYEESHKPIPTTVNEIASEPGSFIGKRVKLEVIGRASIDRARKRLLVMNYPEGSSIDVLYDKTSPKTIKYFTENEPWNQKYIIVGVVKEGELPYRTIYNQRGETVYIQAEKFE